jgi:membrane associated rhomboid family serine protease
MAVKFTAVLWIIHFINMLLPAGYLASYGVLPREYIGLRGVFFFTFIHGDFLHLLSNTFPIFLFLWLLYEHYPKVAHTVLLQGMFTTGFLVWCFARKNFHIGASGLAYALAGFLIAVGFYKKDTKSFILSTIMLITYGTSMFSGLLPLAAYISFEAHLFGALTGIYLAWKYKKRS